METPKLRRSDIGPEYAAPPGLVGFVMADRFYKYSAPTELELNKGRLFQRQSSSIVPLAHCRHFRFPLSNLDEAGSIRF